MPYASQGVKSEVESLVEEESRTLLSVSKDMAKDIAQLALTASLPTPNVSNLNTGKEEVFFSFDYIRLTLPFIFNSFTIRYCHFYFCDCV